MFYVRLFMVAAALAAGPVAAMAANDDPMLRDCLSDDNKRRISGCTAMIETPGLSEEQRSLAHGMRALAYSLLGRFDEAIADYDVALQIRPDFALALNNRAWAYYKLGRAKEGAEDVDLALRLSPGSPFALDTRAHIRQYLGDSEAAIEDYKMAIFNGGEPIVKMYQCGLRTQSLYDGPIDGVYTPALLDALGKCARDRQCDPVPADSECRPEVS